MEPQDAFRFHGHIVVDSAGQALGRVTALYVDAATEEPRWAAIKVNTPVGRQVVVPLTGAAAAGEELRVGFTGSLVATAPAVDLGMQLLPQADQQALVTHYDLLPGAWGPIKRWP